MENFIKSIEFEIRKDSNDVYHNDKDYVSCSGLKMMKKSPLHFKKEEKKQTEAMDWGSAYHTYNLEPELFEAEYHVFDESGILTVLYGEGSKSPRATTKYKDWFNEQVQVAKDKVMIDGNTFKIIVEMSQMLKSHLYAPILISNGEAEMSVYCELTLFNGVKVKVKIRPDYLKRLKRQISDLKTTTDASLNGFPRHAADYDYHIQGALYSDIMDAIEGKQLGWDFFFIAQEKTRPYAFNIFQSGPQFLAQGRHEYEQLLLLYAFCKENDYWPGYQVFTQNKFGVNELTLPPYMMREINWFNHYSK